MNMSLLYTTPWMGPHAHCPDVLAPLVSTPLRRAAQGMAVDNHDSAFPHPQPLPFWFLAMVFVMFLARIAYFSELT